MPKMHLDLFLSISAESLVYYLNICIETDIGLEIHALFGQNGFVRSSENYENAKNKFLKE